MTKFDDAEDADLSDLDLDPLEPLELFSSLSVFFLAIPVFTEPSSIPKSGLAAAEGDLERAIPVSATGAQSLRASLADRDRQVVAWGLSDASSGEMLARSSMPRVRFNSISGADTAYLDVLVAVRDSTYLLKGPLVSGR